MAAPTPLGLSADGVGERVEEGVSEASPEEGERSEREDREARGGERRDRKEREAERQVRGRRGRRGTVMDDKFTSWDSRTSLSHRPQSLLQPSSQAPPVVM